MSSKIGMMWACVLLIFFSSWFHFLPPLGAQSSALRSELYENIGGGCAVMRPLSEELCYQAQMVKAYVDVLADRGTSVDDIYFKVAKKFSINHVLAPHLKEMLKERFMAESQAPRAKLFLEKFAISFGAVSQSDGLVEGQMVIANQGNQPLIIQKAATSCGCLSINLTKAAEDAHYYSDNGTPQGWQKRFAPGEKGLIKVKLNLRHEAVTAGTLERSFFLLSNDPIRGQATIQVTAQVQP